MTIDYSEALKNSPQWIKDAYEKYNKLPDNEKEKTPFLWFVLGKGKGTPPFKMPKKEANYTNKSGSENQFCGNCIFFYIQQKRNFNICSQVRGVVSKNGWCKFYHK